MGTSEQKGGNLAQILPHCDMSFCALLYHHSTAVFFFLFFFFNLVYVFTVDWALYAHKFKCTVTIIH